MHLKIYISREESSLCIYAYIGSPNGYREEEGFSTNEHDGKGGGDRVDGLIKEFALTLLSRQTRAYTRLPRDICGRSLFLGGTGGYDAGPFIYNDNDKRNDNSWLYVSSPASATAAMVKRDVVFMKRDKNSKRDPINRATRTRGYAARPHIFRPNDR